MQSQENLINVIQGDYVISADPEVVLTTVLGSCIAVCLCDPKLKAGGMNHFLLPEGGRSDAGNVRYGANAMELLINGLLKIGAERHRLEAKIFGGAKMMGNLRNIGESNAAFAHKFLQDEGIPCLAESVGGTSARRIRFWPSTGLVRQLIVPGNIEQVAPIQRVAPPVKKADDILLF
ncbi:chemotaxis protein CheD [Primorskyibacter sp. 2E233]|uniref:chemotaxis protein CheD n=1 Tax=Primorskyibacter sp. 2E233 TaxID=3413431 RepID=UPI003BF192FC